MKKITLLLVEDEEAIRDMLRFSLPTAEFNFLAAENATEATRLLADQTPHVIVLDWMLPGKSGIDFIKWIRRQEALQNIPIIMLTAKAEEENKIKALLTGADDYVTKPFSPAELIARIRAILRRGPLLAATGEIRINDLLLKVEQCRAYSGNTLLALTPIEYKMLHFFMTHPNKTYSRDQLITHIWGSNVYLDDRTIDVQIRRLRAKLKPSGHHQRIKTIRGVGYFFARDPDEKK